MSLESIASIHASTSIRFIDSLIYNTSIYSIVSTPAFRVYDSAKLYQTNVSVTTMATPAGITLVAPATAVVVSSGTSQVDFIDITQNLRSAAVTTNASTVYTQTHGQQVAVNISTGIAFATRSTAGGIMKIDGNTRTLSTVSPGGLSGANATCVIVNEASGTWFIGTNNGLVHQINSSGTILDTITLPTTPNVGTAAVHIVGGISYYNDKLLVSTNLGMYYLYRHSTATLLWAGLGIKGSTTAGTQATLCSSSSGQTVNGNSTSGSVGQTIQDIYFDALNPIIETIFVGTSTQNAATFRSPTRALANFNDSSNVISLRVLKGSPTNKVTVDTECQYPEGLQVAGRIIRIRDQGPGRSCIELDTSIPAAVTSLPATDGHDYIEIALVTSGGEKWDVREFTA
jgi:hypothetical protein